MNVAAKRKAEDDCSDERSVQANSMSPLWHFETCRRSAITSDGGAAPEATGAALIAPPREFFLRSTPNFFQRYPASNRRTETSLFR